MSAAPHIPWSPQQRAKLVILLKERGLWLDRHQVCGVDSLADLTHDQAHTLIDRLRVGWASRPPAVAPVAARRAYHGPRQSGGVIQPATDAQRTKIDELLAECVIAGEPRHVLAARLWSQFRYADGCPMSRFTASQVVQCLLAWKSNLLRRVAPPALPRSLDPSIPSPLEPVPF